MKKHFIFSTNKHCWQALFILLVDQTPQTLNVSNSNAWFKKMKNSEDIMLWSKFCPSLSQEHLTWLLNVDKLYSSDLEMITENWIVEWRVVISNFFSYYEDKILLQHINCCLFYDLCGRFEMLTSTSLACDSGVCAHVYQHTGSEIHVCATHMCVI